MSSSRVRVPMPGPNPLRRANGVIGQGVRILDHRGLYATLAGTDEPPKLNAHPMFAAFPLDLATYETERRRAAERVIMHSRAQLALVRPGPEVTALREPFAELITDADIVRRLGDLISGAENRYMTGPGAHPLAGYRVPDFAVATHDGQHRVAELARDGRPLLIDLTDGGAVSAALSEKAGRVTIVAGRAVGEIAAPALLVRPRRVCGVGVLGGQARARRATRIAHDARAVVRRVSRYFAFSSSWYFFVMCSTA